MGTRRERQLTPEQAALAADNVSLAERIAGQFFRKWGGGVPIEDITSDAMLGLCHAVEDFDASRGTKFTSYATHRINGTILDGMRARGHLARTKYAELSDEERDSARWARPVSLEAIAAAMESPFDVVDPNADSLEAEILEEERQREIRECLNGWLNQLPRREREVVVLHWYRGWTLLDIAEFFGFTESRACQIETKAFERIRDLAHGLSAAA